MKFSIKYIGQILLTTFLLNCFHPGIFSQGTHVAEVRRPGMFAGLSLEPSRTDIINEGTLSGSSSSKKNTFSGSAELGYFFSSYFGLSSGIGFNSYKTELTLETYRNTEPGIKDSQGVTYIRKDTINNISELQKISSIRIPIYLNFRLPFNERIGMFLQTGSILAVPVNKNYKTDGYFTYGGYYPDYNITLYGLSEHGFPIDTLSHSKGELKLKPFGFSLIVSAGFDFFIKENMQIGISACYNKSLSNISGYSSSDKIQLTSSTAYQLNSFMGGSSKVTTQSMGLKIIFRYYLK